MKPYLKYWPIATIMLLLFTFMGFSQSIKQRQVSKLFSLAEIAKNNNNDEMALFDVNKILVIDSECGEAYGFRASIEIFSDREQALNDANKCINLLPNYWEGYKVRASILELSDDVSALSDYNKAISLTTNKHDLAELYHYRACIKENLLDYKGSMVDCNKALSLSPKDTYCYSLRAALKLNIDDVYGALSDSDIAVSLAPGVNWWGYFYRGIAKAKLNKNGYCEDLNKAQSLTSDYRVKEAINTYCKLEITY